MAIGGIGIGVAGRPPRAGRAAAVALLPPPGDWALPKDGSNPALTKIALARPGGIGLVP